MARDIIVFDFSLIRGMWETRVKKYIQRRKKEQQRVEQSALQKIKQEWSFMLECRQKGIPQSVYLNNGFVDTGLRILEKLEENSHLIRKFDSLEDVTREKDKYIFELYGEHIKEFPDSLREQTHLKEWHISNTQIHTIPAYIALFQELRVLELSQNLISQLPPEIGYLHNLKELNVSFNRLTCIPPELGNCENVEKMDFSGNLELTELPFELSNLKQVSFVDLSDNKFPTIPICILRMPNLEWLDLSSNNLKDLPEDIDRLNELKTLLLQKNMLKYLPWSLTNMPKLSMLIVSGDSLVEMPSALLETPSLKFISLRDSTVSADLNAEIKEERDSCRDLQQFEKEFMRAYIEDIVERETAPCYTTKISLSLHL
ncbi:leucine-rich repeat-containing protein 2 [Ambystoma mexicanum]|uniref:leucine-rich repeat-containing protein 2 n=1 Tax=Ambystoma mexicanum TaxID=8296 RepID=UPI0037E94096